MGSSFEEEFHHTALTWKHMFWGYLNSPHKIQPRPGVYNFLFKWSHAEPEQTFCTGQLVISNYYYSNIQLKR